MNSFAIYEQAQKTLERNPKDQKAQLIVQLWNAVRGTCQEKLKLQEELTSVKAKLQAAQYDNAQYARKQDMLETKMLQLTSEGMAFDAKSFLQSLTTVAKA